MTAQTCAACQVTLPVVRSVIDRADALAEAVAAVIPWVLDHKQPGFPTLSMRAATAPEWRAIEDALAAYRNGPAPAFTTDDHLPLCSPCYWKAASA